MRTLRLATCFTVAGLLVLAGADDVSACSCISPGPACQNAFQVDAVFSGKVGGITAIPDDRPVPPGATRPPSSFQITFVDVEGFVGVQGTAIDITTPAGGGTCGYTFIEGEEYLVYAYRAGDGTLSTSICSRTQPLPGAEDDLRFLQSLAAPRGARPRVYGTIGHLEIDLATLQAHDYGPLRNVLVTARSSRDTFETQTDARGRYELTIPPGKYEIAASPPSGFSARNLERAVELGDSRACHEADFNLQFDGRVAGIIESKGKPASGISVELMAADAVAGNSHTVLETTNADGTFEFTDLPPGRYVVGVDLTRRIDPETVYPRTFYPGTDDPSSATTIDLGGGERRELVSMSLPAARRQRRLMGIVIFADGRPAPGSIVSLSDPRDTWRQVAGGTRTGPDGAFSFVVHEGLEYRARAFLNVNGNLQRQLQGDTEPFVATGDMSPITVVLFDSR